MLVLSAWLRSCVSERQRNCGALCSQGHLEEPAHLPLCLLALIIKLSTQTHLCISPSSTAGLQSLPVAFSARKIAPAQVPQTGRCCAENCLNSGISPHRSATRAMVVLSPPGIINPSALCNSPFVRTSNACTPLIRFNMVTCSAKDPCRARTPMRVGLSAGIAQRLV